MGQIPAIGELVYHLPTGDLFRVEKRTKFPDSSIKLNKTYPLSECIDPKEAPLSRVELDQVVVIVDAMIESGIYEGDLLSLYNQEQKAQIWTALSIKQRQALKELSTVTT